MYRDEGRRKKEGKVRCTKMDEGRRRCSGTFVVLSETETEEGRRKEAKAGKGGGVREGKVCVLE